jgi:bifunctional oligoribonuclease and PAP phosphatase NrnA
MPIDWPRFCQIIASHQRFVLTSHIRPDCDALGSELAMAAVLRALGKDVMIVNGQSTPPNLAFIDPAKRIRAIGVDITPAQLADREVILVLDTSAWIQLGPMADVIRASQAKKIVLDHHISGDELGAEMFKNPDAEATARLVIEAADQLGVPLTQAIATPAFAGLSTDTGWFRFRSTRGDTMRLAGRLLDAGADPADMYKSLYEQDRAERVRLRGRILANCQTELDGRLVHTSALAEDFTATGALTSDTEDVINESLRIAGTEVAVIFVEIAKDTYKISFRSRGQLDCSVLAAQFEGGGHHAAAGATVPGKFDEVRERVLSAVRAAMTGTGKK